MADPATLLDGELGTVARTTDPADIEAYSLDGWRPTVVIFPSSQEEASQVLRAAERRGMLVAPWGSGSKQGLGYPPSQAGAVVCTSRLAGIPDYDPENLTVTALAGTTLTSLQEIVRARGQKVPLDPPYADTATMGGILAANSSGPRRLLYGAPRDLALGLRAVLPDGRAIRVGGKTVKNVAGYDLTKLFVGSLGTLGLIVEATLKLRPLPEEERTFVLLCRSLEHAGEVARRVLGSADIIPAALELLDERATALIGGRLGLALGSSPVLVVALEGFSEEVSGQEPRLRALAPASLMEDGAPLWRLLTDGLRSGLVARAGVPIAVAARYLEAAGKAAAAHGVDCPGIAGAGSGIVRLFPKTQGGDQAALVAFLKEARSLACHAGGYLVLEEAPLLIKGAVNVWGDPVDVFPALGKIKSVFDPQGIMNPGRYLGGI